MKDRSYWTDVIQNLRKHKCQSRLLYPAKLSITVDGETKVFHDKRKIAKYLSTNTTLQSIGGKHQQKEGNYTLEKARNCLLTKQKERHTIITLPLITKVTGSSNHFS